MNDHPTIDRWLRCLAFLAGLLIATGAVLVWRLPPGTGKVGIDLTLSASAPRPLEVSPSGPVLRARTMTVATASRAARGVLTVTNHSSRALRLRIRALANRRALDNELFFVITASGKPLFRGTQGELRRWTRGSLVLPAGARRELSASSWLGRAPTQAAAASIEEVSLELEAHPESAPTCVQRAVSPGPAQPSSRRPPRWSCGSAA